MPWGANQLLVQPDVGHSAVYPSRLPAASRTLLDILDATTAACPDALALDDGRTALSYSQLAVEVTAVAERLRASGIGVGDRVGVRISSGTAKLYVTILAVIGAGACYVPVDVDDPPERADLVWDEANVTCVITDGDDPVLRGQAAGSADVPKPDDDAWIIFTSGSTGTPRASR
jgi:non-ribosomal peptide synthetase component F